MEQYIYGGGFIMELTADMMHVVHVGWVGGL